MFGKRSNGKVMALAMIESGSASVAILKTGESFELAAYSRVELPLEDRAKPALRTALIQALAAAGEKAIADYTKVSGGTNISTCYCVISAPWTRSFAGSARSKLEHVTPITDAMVSALAKQALADQKDIDPKNLLEASVSRLLLNGYPVSDPAGKRAEAIDIFTLISDCDAELKTAATDTLAKVFPSAQVVWRSSARAALAAAKQTDSIETSLIVQLDGEATDLIFVHKGVIEQRESVEQGFRQILNTLSKGKPAAETLGVMEMIEKEECDDAACEELRQSIAKAEPELVHLFGEALAKLSSHRKLPDELVLIAPPALTPWLSRFFARIDFTQFTATTRPFSVKVFSPRALPAMPVGDQSALSDTGLSIGLGLVNMELSS